MMTMFVATRPPQTPGIFASGDPFDDFDEDDFDDDFDDDFEEEWESELPGDDDFDRDED